MPLKSKKMELILKGEMAFFYPNRLVTQHSWCQAEKAPRQKSVPLTLSDIDRWEKGGKGGPKGGKALRAGPIRRLRTFSRKYLLTLASLQSNLPFIITLFYTFVANKFIYSHILRFIFIHGS